MICASTSCIANGSLNIREAFEDQLKKNDLNDEIVITITGCNGLCANGPIVAVMPDDIFYQMVTEKDVSRIVQEHLLEGRHVRDLIYKLPKEKISIPKMSEIGFYKKQRLITLSNRGLMDPESIDEYIAFDGYKALAKALTEYESDDVIKEIKDSGLRGRGGAGFPTGLKWEFCRKSKGTEKYIICNADEGDPGAFMDRYILESDPHSVIEGMVIGGYAIGSSEGIIYLRAEYPLAMKRLNIAIKKAHEYGLLGDNIFDSGFKFDIIVNKGAGAFVCGEETSLISSLEGESPEPRTKPPFPAVSGYKGKPTNINNVETWANIPRIISRGAEWFSSIGTETSKGTKVFSIVGKLKNTGLVEVPMGITVREMVFEIGGGIVGDKKFKAVQMGGPSGGCIPKSLLDTAIDYESLKKAGAIMGSGGMIVMDENDCMVEVARYFLSFTQDESCGKCTPCREGTRHMLNILTDITEGKGTEEDLVLLEKMCYLIKDTALCQLGVTAPNPVLSTIRYFRHEYEAHIRDKRCPSRACKALIEYSILEDKCTGCRLCFKSCPVNAITGEVKKIHKIDREMCIKCNMCFDVCKFDAVRYE